MLVMTSCEGLALAGERVEGSRSERKIFDEAVDMWVLTGWVELRRWGVGRGGWEGMGRGGGLEDEGGEGRDNGWR